MCTTKKTLEVSLPLPNLNPKLCRSLHHMNTWKLYRRKAHLPIFHENRTQLLKIKIIYSCYTSLNDKIEIEEASSDAPLVDQNYSKPLQTKTNFVSLILQSPQMGNTLNRINLHF